MLSQLSLLVHTTQFLGEILTRVEKNVADMKRIMTFGDDDNDNIVIDDSP